MKGGNELWQLIITKFLNDPIFFCFQPFYWPEIFDAVKDSQNNIFIFLPVTSWRMKLLGNRQSRHIYIRMNVKTFNV